MKTLHISHETGLLLLSLALLALIALVSPQFVAPSHLADLLNDTGPLIILALGEMLVLLTRGVDLSVAANLALTGMIVALFNDHYPHVSMTVIVLSALCIGTVLGMLSGWVVWLLRVPSIVVTLGTMSIYRGLVYIASNGTWVNSNQMSPAFLGLIRTQCLGFGMLAWLAIISAALMSIFLSLTTLGRNLFAAGNNPSAAAYAGIDIGRMQWLAFTVSGALAGLCGYLWVSRYGVAYTEIANGYELQVIAACVIGGVSINGGVGSVLGVCLGALFLGIINNALPLIGVSPFFQMAVSGLVLTVAVVVNARERQKTSRQILEQAST